MATGTYNEDERAEGSSTQDKVLLTGRSGLAGTLTIFDAINDVAKADSSNIQEVAASQLGIINSYYQSGLQQSQQSFRWSLIWGGIGLGFLIASVIVLLFRQPTEVALASGIGGAIVEVFAATYQNLYKHASDQLAAFRTSLESTQRLLLANSMCEKLEGEIRADYPCRNYSFDGQLCCKQSRADTCGQRQGSTKQEIE